MRITVTQFKELIQTGDEIGVVGRAVDVFVWVDLSDHQGAFVKVDGDHLLGEIARLDKLGYEFNLPIDLDPRRACVFVGGE